MKLNELEKIKQIASERDCKKWMKWRTSKENGRMINHDHTEQNSFIESSNEYHKTSECIHIWMTTSIDPLSYWKTHMHNSTMESNENVQGNDSFNKSSTLLRASHTK